MKNSWFKLVLGALAVTSLSLLNSCEKTEKPVTPIIPLEVRTVQIPEGADYANQFFFQLSSNTTVGNNLRDNWDLALESTTSGYHIRLNGAKLMYAYNSNKTNFDSTYTYNNAKKYTWVDQPSGNADSTAIGEWGVHSGGSVTSYNQVYIVDRGKTSANVTLEVRKIWFQGLSNGTYSLKYANLDGTDEHTVQIAKNTTHDFVYLSLDNGGQEVSVAPTPDSWDLEFTMYTHIFDTTPPGIPIAVTNLPYLVNGVLLNPKTISVSRDISSNVPFDSITLAMAQTRAYRSEWNVIGYDWKTFDFNDVNYTITPNLKYFIKTQEGKYYKMRFTEFYNNMGVKGYPTFQYQLLQ